MKAKRLVERDDARYMRLLRQYKMRPVQIARRCKVRVSTVYRGLERERDREAAERRAATATIHGPRLTLDFGSSCKPMSLLRCSDIHPNGPMPTGTHCCCAACHKTGIEGHPALRYDSLPAPEPKAASPKPQPKASRKQKRAARQLAGAA